MSQVSSQLWQLVSWIQDDSTQASFERSLQQLLRYSKSYNHWMLGLTVLLFVLNWQLLFAIASGLTTMTLVYRGQRERWKIPTHWRKLWQRTNSKLMLTLASGGVATLSSYLAIALLREASNPGLALGIMAEGYATLALLGLVSWQILSRPAERKEDPLSQILYNLADADPLKRLIAVRQATQWAIRDQSSQSRLSDRFHIADCFHLVLSRETDSIVRSALQDGLQTLNSGQQLGTGTAPFTPVLRVHQPELAPREFSEETSV